MREAISEQPCLQAELITTTRPSAYRQMLQAAADQHDDLVIAGSFLLADAVVDTATANPGTRFVLIDPLVMTTGPSNLAIVTFREDQAGFLSGALAGLTTRTGVIAGVYGLEDEHDRRYRLGFERGARYANATVRTLGAYQGPQDGPPYANPAWGSAQARAFFDQGADVIFTTGDGTGQGALTATASGGRQCITVAIAARSSGPDCLVGTVVLHLDRAVAVVTSGAATGRWEPGERSFGVTEGAIELNLSPAEPSELRARLRTLADRLAARTILNGA